MACLGNHTAVGKVTMDLYAHCLFYAAHLGTIEKQHGSKPTSEPVVKEIREGDSIMNTRKSRLNASSKSGSHD